MPLVASLGETMVLAESLTEQDRGKDFRCPACKAPFRIVLPKTDIMKHFRHVTGAEHWEPETADHLSMKMSISKTAQSLGYVTRLEQRIGEDDHYAIADIFIDDGRGQIAIECQCSSISIEVFKQRDQFYKQLGIIPIWILGGSFFRHATTQKQRERANGRSYQIQKIGSLEKMPLQEKRLFYYGKGTLYSRYFRFRWTRHDEEVISEDGTEVIREPPNSATLGWFSLRQTNLRNLVIRTWNLPDVVAIVGRPSVTYTP